MLWKEKERSRISAVQMDNFRGLLDIKWMDRVSNAQIRELCGVTKGIDERIDVGVLWWFSHVKRTENDRFAMSVFVEGCSGSRSAR